MYFQFKDKRGRHHKMNILGCPTAAIQHLKKQGCTDIRHTLFVYDGE